MEKTRYVRVFTDGTKNPLRFCVKDIHGNLIVIDKQGKDPINEYHDSLPEEFTSITLMEEERIKEEIFEYLEFMIVHFLDTQTPTKNINELEERITDALEQLESFWERNWEIIEIKSTRIVLKTHLAYVLGDPIDG